MTTRSFARAAALALFSVASFPVLAAPSPAAPVPVLNWATCAGYPSAQCATARVPLDYDAPLGGTIGVALARIPAASPARKIGTVFLNPGGPGASGVDFALNGFGQYLWSLLGGRFDVVGFDPRGIARSTPIRCFATDDDRLDFIFAVPTFPYLERQERPFFEHYRSLASRCLGRSPRIAPHMSTADVARDLDLLREAVGDDRLTYLGFSYGSYIGNTYANLFPGNIRALVIDGVLDPRLWSSGRQIDADRLASEEVFEEFTRLCDAARRECAFSGGGGAAARYRALARSLRESPLVFPDGFAYSYDILIEETIGALYSPQVWGGPDGFAAVLHFLAEAVAGNAAANQQAQLLRQALRDRLQPQGAAAYNNQYPDGFFGNQCADIQYPWTFAAFKATGEYAERGSIFGPYWWWVTPACANWPVSPDRYAGPWFTQTSAPVLIVGNYYDPATDYHGAVASSTLIKGSRLLTYAGWGHTGFFESECVVNHVVRYLVNGTLPAKYAVCPANPNPFLQPTSTARARERLVPPPSLRPPLRVPLAARR
jgi:pimeloyl-ACP methyl ester carboxylesterase